LVQLWQVVVPHKLRGAGKWEVPMSMNVSIKVSLLTLVLVVAVALLTLLFLVPALSA
jgi:hypothetical protein